MFFALFPCFACIQSKHGVLQINAPILLSTQRPDQLLSNSRCFALLEALNATTPTGWWAKTRRWTEVTTVFEFSENLIHAFLCWPQDMCEINAQELVFTCKVCSKVEAGTHVVWLETLVHLPIWRVKPPVFQHQFHARVEHPSSSIHQLSSYPAILVAANQGIPRWISYSSPDIFWLRAVWGCVNGCRNRWVWQSEENRRSLRLQTRCSLCGEGQHRVNSWKQSWRCCRCAVGTWWDGWGRWSMMVGCCVIAFLEVGSVTLW